MVETNAKALIEVLRSIPGPRHLCLEEGTLASWLYEVLSPQTRGLNRNCNHTLKHIFKGAPPR